MAEAVAASSHFLQPCNQEKWQTTKRLGCATAAAAAAGGFS